MYQSRQVCSFSSVLTLQQTPGHLELKHSELHLLIKNTEVSVFPPRRRLNRKSRRMWTDTELVFFYIT